MKKYCSHKIQYYIGATVGKGSFLSLDYSQAFMPLVRQYLIDINSNELYRSIFLLHTTLNTSNMIKCPMLQRTP